MPVIRDALTRRFPGHAPGDSCSLPSELLAEIVEQLSIPIVVEGGADDLFLNAKARLLWPMETVAPPILPVTVDGATQSLLAIDTACTHGPEPTPLPRVHVPDGEEYEIDAFPWKPGPQSPAWRVRALYPLNPGIEEGTLLIDKLNRLKAIVHECRNTLTAAREALAFLQEGAVGDLNPEQTRFLKSAIEDLEGLSRATVELASLWVTGASVLRLIPRPTDLRHVIEHTTAGAQPIAERQGVSLRVEISDPPPVLTGDHELLVQALRNVVSNALQHTLAGGEIWIRVFSEDAEGRRTPNAKEVVHQASSRVLSQDESIVIEVQDSGTGIPLADQERVFKPFERGPSDGSSEGSTPMAGMGLGLAIARDITSQHGGLLHVRSVRGQGSCFIFRFPRSGMSPRAWMLRATQQALDAVRPLRASLAAVLLHIETDRGHPEQHIDPQLLSTVQQVVTQSLRPTDTVLAIETQLLLLIRGSTRSGAFALIDRILQSLRKVDRAGGGRVSECHLVFGVAAFPGDGDDAEALLSHAEAELSVFATGGDLGTEENHG